MFGKVEFCFCYAIIESMVRMVELESKGLKSNVKKY